MTSLKNTHDVLGRTELLASFASLKTAFGDSLTWACQREAEFEQLRQVFLKEMSKHLRDARKRLPQAHPAYGPITSFVDVMEATRTEWDTNVAGRAKGVQFQQDFGDSLLVFVNGKVKSGKSSLGNYMAWGNTDPTLAMKRKVPKDAAPDYFSAEQTDVAGGDAHAEAQKQREFRVGAVEATSSIQGFRLPGLTWVDSPGLHSMNESNGALARRYVEHADLILYTMKSDSPGRDSDLAEISRLYQKDKKFVLLLTGSDDIEEEPAPDGFSLVQALVMKDKERCARQAEYVRGALAEDCGPEAAANADILSISARYAQLHEDDADGFARSGMEEWFATLDRIARSEGIQLKQQTPVRNLYHFLQDCHKDLQPYEQLITGFRQPLRELKERLDKQLNTVVHAAQADVLRFVDSYFDGIGAANGVVHREAVSVQEQLANFPGALNAQLQQVGKQHLADIFEKMIAGFSNVIEDSYEESELVNLPNFTLEKIMEKVPQVRRGTRTLTGLIGSALLGTAGFFLGGPPGAALGASLGGTLGGAMGSSASTGFNEVEVTVGDNLAQIHLQASRDGQQALDKQLRSNVAALWHSIEEEVDDLLLKLHGDIQQFDTGLQRLLRVTKEKTATP
jgi:hypothetical protein